MKKYKLRQTMVVGQQIIDRTFNYVLKVGDIIEDRGYAYVDKYNVWFDKESVENNPDIFEPIEQ